MHRVPRMDTLDNVRQIRATELLDPSGSLVESGLRLANAVIDGLNSGEIVQVSLHGLKGASSSYFNVFLRRIDEACGVARLNDHVQLEFGSRVQKMMFDASLDALRRGHAAPAVSSAPVEEESQPPVRSVWSRILRMFTFKR